MYVPGVDQPADGYKEIFGISEPHFYPDFI
jgi:hypothetical protein